MNTVIAVNRLTKAFGTVIAVNDISFRVEAGKFMGCWAGTARAKRRFYSS